MSGLEVVSGRSAVQVGDPMVTGWVKVFASWQPWSKAASEDLAPSVLTGFAVSALEGVLEREGAEAVGPASVSLVEAGHGDLFMRNVGVVVLAEVVGIVLRTPDPMPAFDLFPRWSRFVARVRWWR